VVDFCVVHDPAAKTYIGVAKRDKSSDNTFQRCVACASYSEYTGTGSKAVSGRRLYPAPRPCVNQLEVRASQGRDNKGAYFQGLAIRHSDHHESWPRPITGDDTPPDEPPNGGGGSNPPTNLILVMDWRQKVTAK